LIGSFWFVAVVSSSPEVGSVFGLYWFASVLPPHVYFGGVILRRHSLLVFIGEELACLDHFSLIFYLLPAMGLD
jgi:hypothetical protein